jgi:cobalt-zinc-cadmium efflux system outer membrane protein
MGRGEAPGVVPRGASEVGGGREGGHASPPASPAAPGAPGAPGARLEPLEPLDLERALELAERHHPGLEAARQRRLAAAGRTVQDGAWANPELGAAMEAAPFEGRTTRDAEYIVGITQPLPIGGRVGAAAREARAAEVRLGHELEAFRLEVRRNVRSEVIGVLFADRLAGARRELLEAAEAGVRVARARLEGGDAVRDDVTRAELEREEATLALLQAEALSREARLRLAEAMGLPERVPGGVRGDLEESLEIPALESLLEGLERHPDLLAARAGVLEGEARLRLAEAERIPDVSVQVAYHRFESTSTDAFDVGFGLPLPIFDRNRGKIAESRALIEEARAREDSQRLSLETRARRARARAAEALLKAARYREEILPRARAVLESMEARHRAGDVSLVELLPVRRDAARLGVEHLEALRDLMMSWGELRAAAGW